jgi:SAM-dependent methyltransferase
MLAAAAVGPGGHAIGIDMTEAMAERARASARALGFAHVEVRAGDALNVPVDSESADFVISNGVLNLAPDKRQAFGEVVRILKPGGQFLYAEIIVASELSESTRRDIDLGPDGRILHVDPKVSPKTVERPNASRSVRAARTSGLSQRRIFCCQRRRCRDEQEVRGARRSRLSHPERSREESGDGVRRRRLSAPVGRAVDVLHRSRRSNPPRRPKSESQDPGEDVVAQLERLKVSKVNPK